jgi:hypothetical protein
MYSERGQTAVRRILGVLSLAKKCVASRISRQHGTIIHRHGRQGTYNWCSGSWITGCHVLRMLGPLR